MNDHCFVYKTPVVELLDPTNQGIRKLIRTYGRIWTHDCSIEYQKNGDILQRLTIEKLKDCINKLSDNTTSESIKHDCILYLRYIKNVYSKNLPRLGILDQYSAVLDEYDTI